MIARVSGIGILLVGAVAYLLQILGSFTNEFFIPKKALVETFIHLAVNIAPVFTQVCLNPALLVIASGICLILIGKKR